MKLLRYLLLYMAVSVSLCSIAQHIGIVEDDQVTIKIDGSGKIKPPQTFGLIEGKKYTFNIDVDFPKQQQVAMWKYMKKKCESTLDKIENPHESSLRDGYTLLYGKDGTDELKKQLQKMIDILGDNDPVQKFSNEVARGFSFSLFLGVPFLQANLFQSNAEVYIEVGNDQKKKGLTGTTTTITNVPAEYNKINLSIAVPDLKKRFLIEYFNESRKLIANKIDAIDPKKFYNNPILTVSTLQKSFERLKQDLDKIDLHSPAICDDNIMADYRKLRNDFNNNQLLQISQTEWFAVWMWYSEGDFKLSPLEFTDAKLLPFGTALNDGSGNAAKYDSYINSAVTLMETATTLNETKGNYNLMDSLLKEQGKGDERFPNTSIVNNGEKAKEMQLVNYTIQTVTMRVIDPKMADKTIMLGYDAANNFKSQLDKKIEVLSNDNSVEIVAYNIKAAQELVVKETSKDIADQSKVITDLNAVADASASTLKEAPGASATFAKLVVLLSGSSAIVPSNVKISNAIDVQVESEADLAEGAVLPTGIVTVRKIGNNIIITSSIKRKGEKPTVETTDVSATLLAQLTANKLLYCTSLRDLIMKALIDQFEPETTKFKLDFGGATRMKELINSIETKINDIITENIKNYIAARPLKPIYNDVAIKLNMLNAAVEIYKTAATYTLPPKELKANTDTAAQMRNNIYTMEEETSAKKKNFELSLSNKKNKEVLLTRKDSYKTSPPHWITASMGVAYVLNEFRRSDATIVNNEVVNTPDEQQVRLITGIHIHPWPILLADNRFIGKLSNKELLSRFSLFGGVSFPKPLYNLHTGISADIFTGVKLTGGVHFYRYTGYKIVNNQFASEKSKYLFNGAFVSITIEPVTFVKLLGIFNL